MIELDSGTMYLGIVSDPTGQKLSPQDYLPSPLQMPTTSLDCYLCFGLNGCKSDDPMILSSGLINLVKWLTELRKILYLLDHQFVIKQNN